MLVATAATLFAEHGYEATSIEAVLEAIEVELANAAIAATRGVTDPAEILRIGADTFLEAAQAGRIRRIVLLDAPAALGWQKWREIEARHGLGLIKATLEAAAAHGQMPRDLTDVHAHMLLAALIEVALMVARAEDPKAAASGGRAALGRLIDRMLGP